MAVCVLLSFLSISMAVSSSRHPFCRKIFVFAALSTFNISPYLVYAASISSADDFRDAAPAVAGTLDDQRNEYNDLRPQVLSNGSVKFDLIPDDYKIVVKVDLSPRKMNSTHVQLLRNALAREIGVNEENVQVSRVIRGDDRGRCRYQTCNRPILSLIQIDTDNVFGNIVEVYVVYNVPYEGGRQEMNILVPAAKIIQRLSLPSLNRFLKVVPIAYVKQKVDLRDDVTISTAVTDARIWNMFEKEIWKSWQLPFLIVSCLLLLLLLTFSVVFFCFRQQINKKTVEHETKHVCLFPVVKPDLVKQPDAVQPEPSALYLTQENLDIFKRQPIRIKAKGLLERRGSNASLTIDLNPSLENLSASSFSRDSTNEEYLLSAGNRMTRKQLKSCLKNPKVLHSEFWEIPMNHPEKVEIAGSGTKNRYRTILPNEHSRVKLDELNGDLLTTYINANYIKGYDGEERAYIATQGPMPHTVVDFWRMVWSERVCIVVMITKLREKNKIKCEPYIPDRVGRYGDIEVTIVSVTARDGYVVREMYIKKGNQCVQVLHFWYTTWPDHKTPVNPRQLVAMAVEVESHRCDNNSRRKGPVLVHCSAGIGRTGCFIASSIGMQQLIEENMVDVLGIICIMRQDRGGMVQTAEQYEFVHRSLCLFKQTLPGKSSGGE